MFDVGKTLLWSAISLPFIVKCIHCRNSTVHYKDVDKQVSLANY